MFSWPNDTLRPLLPQISPRFPVHDEVAERHGPCASAKEKEGNAKTSTWTPAGGWCRPGRRAELSPQRAGGALLSWCPFLHPGQEVIGHLLSSRGGPDFQRNNMSSLMTPPTAELEIQFSSSFLAPRPRPPQKSQLPAGELPPPAGNEPEKQGTARTAATKPPPGAVHGVNSTGFSQRRTKTDPTNPAPEGRPVGDRPASRKFQVGNSGDLCDLEGREERKENFYIESQRCAGAGTPAPPVRVTRSKEKLLSKEGQTARSRSEQTEECRHCDPHS